MIPGRGSRVAWFALIVTSSATAGAQATVAEEPAATPASGLRQAQRERRSINLTGDSPDANGSPVEVPEFHTVERGDTLWDITGTYFGNPWRWPSVWGLNPQITNPHWIFPGDQVRLLEASLAPSVRPSRTQEISASGPLSVPVSRVAPRSVFLRQQGFLDTDQAQAAGTVVGSPEDQLLLSEGDQAYLEFRNRTPHVGEQYTIYQDGPNATGHGHGHVVRVLGTAMVESWDRTRHIATARIVESLDGIERGERVAAIPRRFDVVAPRRNSTDLRANIVATIQPRELLGQNMVVFMDKGSGDHVEVGNRLFVVRRGDGWERTLPSAAARSSAGAGLDRDGDGNVDGPPGSVASSSQLPEEIVGEVQVMDVREHTATAVVTSSTVDLQVGDVLEMRRNY